MTNDEGYHSLTPHEVAEVLESGAEVFLIDIRPPRQFHQGHLPEAISLPADDFADRYEREINPDDSVILICEKGLNSIAAAKFLISQDFTNVALLAGGMIAWREMQGESD
jgi:rhodanese-related sulfurtransferase